MPSVYRRSSRDASQWYQDDSLTRIGQSEQAAYSVTSVTVFLAKS